MNRPIVLIYLSLLLSLGRSAICQGIDAQMRNEDKRLDKTVSISRNRIAIGQLLRQFSDQTAVTLDINDLDLASGYDLLVQCDHVPVGQMMDALYSLVSTRGAEWKWLRAGKPDQYSYLLVETKPAKERPERYRTLARRGFLDYIAMMRRLSELGPDERLAHKNELRSTLKIESDDALNYFLGEKQFWSEAKLFFGILSPEQQEQVLDGTAPFSFHADQIPASLYAHYHASFAAGGHSTSQPDGSLKPDPEPKEFTIAAYYPRSVGDELAPSIRIHYKNSFAVTMLGSGYPSYTIRATVLKDWFLPGDGEIDPASSRIVPKKRVEDLPDKQLLGPDGRLFYETSPPGEMAAHLQEMAAGASIPLLAILPPSEMGLVGKPATKQVGELLQLMQRGLHEMYKWRGGVLLLNNADWFLEQEPAVPYRWLQLLGRGRNTPASVADFVEVNSKINDVQAQWLGSHWGLHGFRRLGPLLNYGARHPRLLTSDGFDVGLDDLPLLRALGYIRANLHVDRPVRVRLVKSTSRDGLTQSLQFRVETVDREKGVWVLSTIQDLTTPVVRLK